VLASCKLSFADLLAAACVLAHATKGVSALQLARDIGVNARTAWILAHKLSQALGAEAKPSGQSPIWGPIHWLNYFPLS
jgi:hypothetical protein